MVGVFVAYWFSNIVFRQLPLLHSAGVLHDVLGTALQDQKDGVLGTDEKRSAASGSGGGGPSAGDRSPSVKNGVAVAGGARSTSSSAAVGSSPSRAKSPAGTRSPGDQRRIRFREETAGLRSWQALLLLPLREMVWGGADGTCCDCCVVAVLGWWRMLL